MPICLTSGAAAIVFASQAFTLDWTHSVEKTRWQEDWRVDGGLLVLEEARVEGSGAGMDPGPDAVLVDGFWRWSGQGRSVPELVLARSGATGAEWSICTAREGCISLNSLPVLANLDPVRIKPC